ncbi:uncharacterized protein TNIN_25251 [Trichonephila inaurata madagascariensis]|uniref:Uncharacterized protein n=1 Tax=Trichonephila inaurata madagascariensis TaxID=2747483 RepID=A0A8X6ID68_9ARAC|nr:uncharacterized protein TNIN_25251 [Trichonephila inaurata madagascariensis]
MRLILSTSWTRSLTLAKITKIRPVFVATAREGGKPSLNDVLHKGPSLIELIPDILDRFGLYPIVLSADIEKAFPQLVVVLEHRDFLRFFYPLEESREMVYQHCQVVFGVCLFKSILIGGCFKSFA